MKLADRAGLAFAETPHLPAGLVDIGVVVGFGEEFLETRVGARHGCVHPILRAGGDRTRHRGDKRLPPELGPPSWSRIEARADRIVAVIERIAPGECVEVPV